MYQKFTERRIMFFDKKFSESSEFFYLELGPDPSIKYIVETMNILIEERHIESKLKFLEERKKLRFTLQLKDPFLHSSVRIWDTFSEVMLVMNLE